MKITVATDADAPYTVDALLIGDTGLAIHRIDSPSECWHIVSIDGGYMVAARSTKQEALERAIAWGLVCDFTDISDFICRARRDRQIQAILIQDCIRYCLCGRIRQDIGWDPILNKSTTKTGFLNIAGLLLCGRPDGTRITWDEFETAVRNVQVSEIRM